MWNVTKISFSLKPNSISETLPKNLFPVRLVYFGFDVLASSTFNTTPFSSPTIKVDEFVVCGETVRAETFAVNCEFDKIRLGASVFLSSSLKPSQP